MDYTLYWTTLLKVSQLSEPNPNSMQLGLTLDTIVASHPPYHPNLPQQTFQSLLEFYIELQYNSTSLTSQLQVSLPEMSWLAIWLFWLVSKLASQQLVS